MRYIFIKTKPCTNMKCSFSRLYIGDPSCKVNGLDVFVDMNLAYQIIASYNADKSDCGCRWQIEEWE